jgi:hypothetical protein
MSPRGRKSSKISKSHKQAQSTTLSSPVGQLAVNGLKQALDLATESADAFAPLKSVLGGLRIILRGCEVS